MKSLFNTVPGSIVLGSIIISVSILLSGGIILYINRIAGNLFISHVKNSTTSV